MLTVGTITGVGAMLGATIFAAQILPGFDLTALLTSVSPSVLIMTGAYLLIRGAMEKEAERGRLAAQQHERKDQTIIELVAQSKALAEQAANTAAITERVTALREARRDQLIAQRIQPISNRLGEIAALMGGMLQERGSEREAMTIATAGLRHAAEEIQAINSRLGAWRTEDLDYRNKTVIPALNFLKDIPAIRRKVASLEGRVNALEKPLKAEAQQPQPEAVPVDVSAIDKHQGD